MDLSEAYHRVIDMIVSTFGTTHSMMHIHVGMAIYLAVQLIVRTRRGSMTALNVVFAAEIGNEVLDRLYRGFWNWPDTLSDIALTMMWPLAITVVSQYRRARWERMHRRAAELQALLRDAAAGPRPIDLDANRR